MEGNVDTQPFPWVAVHVAKCSPIMRAGNNPDMNGAFGYGNFVGFS